MARCQFGDAVVVSFRFEGTIVSLYVCLFVYHFLPTFFFFFFFGGRILVSWYGALRARIIINQDVRLTCAIRVGGMYLPLYRNRPTPFLRSSHHWLTPAKWSVTTRNTEEKKKKKKERDREPSTLT